MQPLTRTVSTNGKVELTLDFQAHAAAAGQIKQLPVKVGDTVKAGQLLVRLDDTAAQLQIQNADSALASAQNTVSNMRAGGTSEERLAANTDITNARTTLQQAQTRLDSLQLLQGKGAASANEISSAQTQVTDAQNRLSGLLARQTGRYSSQDLSVQRGQVIRSHAELAAAQSSLAASDIRAPFAGTVYSVPVLPYANVSVGEDLVNVADLKKIRVRAFFDEPEIGRLAVGQPVRIVWDAKPERTWHGHIQQVPTSITNYGTRNVGECLIQVDDAEGDLIPNVNVTVYVTTLHRDSVLTIPREALRTDGTNNFVFTIADGKLHRVAVTVNVVTQTQVEIGSGLKAGDNLVQVPMNDVELRDGIPVKVQP
jgi:HlyD family secretion protein